MNKFFSIAAVCMTAAFATTALATDPVPTTPAPTPTPSWTSPEWVVTARPGTGFVDWGRATSDTRLETNARVGGDSIAIKGTDTTLTRNVGVGFGEVMDDSRVRGDTRLGFDGCPNSADCGDSGFDLLSRVDMGTGAYLSRAVEGTGGPVGVDLQLMTRQQGRASADATIERGRFHTDTRPVPAE